MNAITNNPVNTNEIDLPKQFGRDIGVIIGETVKRKTIPVMNILKH
jgi:hypothetical protein